MTQCKDCIDCINSKAFGWFCMKWSEAISADSKCRYWKERVEMIKQCKKRSPVYNYIKWDSTEECKNKILEFCNGFNNVVFEHGTFKNYSFYGINKLNVGDYVINNGNYISFCARYMFDELYEIVEV